MSWPWGSRALPGSRYGPATPCSGAGWTATRGPRTRPSAGRNIGPSIQLPRLITVNHPCHGHGPANLPRCPALTNGAGDDRLARYVVDGRGEVPQRSARDHVPQYRGWGEYSPGAIRGLPSAASMPGVHAGPPHRTRGMGWHLGTAAQTNSQRPAPALLTRLTGPQKTRVANPLGPHDPPHLEVTAFRYHKGAWRRSIDLGCSAGAATPVEVRLQRT